VDFFHFVHNFLGGRSVCVYVFVHLTSKLMNEFNEIQNEKHAVKDHLDIILRYQYQYCGQKYVRTFENLNYGTL
jgi:hypothetical protein